MESLACYSTHFLSNIFSPLCHFFPPYFYLLLSVKWKVYTHHIRELLGCVHAFENLSVTPCLVFDPTLLDTPAAASHAQCAQPKSCSVHSRFASGVVFTQEQVTYTNVLFVACTVCLSSRFVDPGFVRVVCVSRPDSLIKSRNFDSRKSSGL